MEYLPKVILPIIISVIAGYLLGSVSFSIIFTRIFNKDDIRNYGSGNAGATNVLRSVGKLAAALTFVFDFLKCVLSVILGIMIVKNAGLAQGIPEEFSGNLAVIGKYAAGFGCVFGHIFPVYFSFRGGKGVVTTAAMVALLDYRVFIPTIITFAVIFAVKRIVSLSSITAACGYPIFTFLVKFFFDCELSPLKNHGTDSLQLVVIVTAASVLMSAIVIAVHWQNIGRLRRGEEKPISFKTKNADTASAKPFLDI